MIRVTWTEEMDTIVKDRRGILTAEQIGALLGLTRNSVIGRINRMGLPKIRHANPGGRPKSRKKKPVTLSKVRRAPAAPITAEQDLLIPFEQRKTFADLGKRDCRWPVGDVGTPGFVFCGARVAEDRPYCVGHCAAAYERPYCAEV